MTDRRMLWSNGRVAHQSLVGKVTAERFVEGKDQTVTFTPAAALRDAPFGKVERQLLTGDTFCVLDTQDGWAFGFARANGYTGYVEQNMLTASIPPATHIIRNRLTMARDKPDFKTRKEEVLLSLGSPVTVVEDDGKWQRLRTFQRDMFVPSAHTREIDDFETDPVAVAHDLVGTPYVWGGDSAIGIDCSGLVQIACRLCGVSCPGDSDLQEASLGETLPSGTSPERGDLLFWKGHVAWVANSETLLHANAHHMAVAYEPMREAIARIASQGDGPVTRHARLTLP